MRKSITLLLALTMVLCLLCPVAIAAESEELAGQIYNIRCGEGVYLTYVDGNLMGQTYLQNRNDTDMTQNFPGATWFGFRYRCGESVEEGSFYNCYVLTEKKLPSADNIVSIKQGTAEEENDAMTVEFNISVETLVTGDYYVYLAGPDRQLDRLSSYTPTVTFHYDAGNAGLQVKLLGTQTNTQTVVKIHRGKVWQSTQRIDSIFKEATLQWWPRNWNAGKYTVEATGFVTWNGQLAMTGDDRITLVQPFDVFGYGMPLAKTNGALYLQNIYEYLSEKTINSDLSEDYYQSVVDFNGSGDVNILDYQYLLEKIETLP